MEKNNKKKNTTATWEQLHLLLLAWLAVLTHLAGATAKTETKTTENYGIRPMVKNRKFSPQQSTIIKMTTALLFAFSCFAVEEDWQLAWPGTTLINLITYGRCLVKS